METQGNHVTIRRTRQDYFAFSRLVTRPLRNVRIYYLVAVIVLMLVFINVMALIYSSHLLPKTLQHSYGLKTGVFIAAAILLQLAMQRCFLPAINRASINDNQAFLRLKQAEINDKGYHEWSDVSDSFVAWEGVDRIEKSGDYLLIYVDRISAFFLPLRNFDTPEQAERFYEQMRAYWNKAHWRGAVGGSA